MNTIETLDSTPFKHLVMSIGALPTSFVDSMSYYECMAWLIAYIRDKVVPACNNNAEAIKEIQNWIETLDLQDYVDNKLDEMVESGELATIIANYIVVCGGNAKELGCAGDGETDDTAAINAAIATLVSNGVNKLVFPAGEYVVSDVISVPSNFTLEGMKGSVLKYVGNGTSGNIIELAGTDADNFIDNVTIEGITIDGTNQVYKGGYSMATPAVTHTDPLYKGLTCIKAEFVHNVTIKNCTMKDVYGDGIIVRYGSTIKINNNSLYSVSSGNITVGGQAGYDNHGDGIATFFSFDCNITGNTVINTRTYLAGQSDAVGKPCGRSGLEFEYALNQDCMNTANPSNPVYNPPFYYLIPTVTRGGSEVRWSEGNIMDGNYVYGYTKGIHLESYIKPIITNNKILFCHVGLMMSCSCNTLIKGNYFNNEELGRAPQGGYDIYWAGVAISQYSADERRYCTIVEGNSFDGTWMGVSVGTDYVEIIGNVFTTRKGVRQVVGSAKGIAVLNNSFNLSAYSDLSIASQEFPIFLYGGEKDRIIGNTVVSEVATRIQYSSSHNIIRDNNLKNCTIYAATASTRNLIDGNIIYGGTYENDCIYNNIDTDSVISNNIIEMVNDNTHYAIRGYGATSRVKYANNKVTVAATRTLEVCRNEAVTLCVYEGNRCYGLVDDGVFWRAYTVSSCTIANNATDNPKAKVFYSTGSFAGINTYHNNFGKVDAAGAKINNSLNNLNQTYVEQGNLMIKGNLAADATTLGWTPVTSGYYTTTTWTNGNAYNANVYVKNASDKVYIVVTKGSGNVSEEPTDTTGAEFTTADGYKWKYMNNLPTFRTIACS